MKKNENKYLKSLVTLLQIYVISLYLIGFLSDGPDIGVVLATIVLHAIWMGIRGLRTYYKDRTLENELKIHAQRVRLGIFVR